MANVELDSDVDAPRRILAAVLTLAVEDLKLPKGDKHRLESESFFWGANKDVSTKYLVMLGMEPERFKNAVKAKMVDTLAV